MYIRDEKNLTNEQIKFIEKPSFGILFSVFLFVMAIFVLNGMFVGCCITMILLSVYMIFFARILYWNLLKWKSFDKFMDWEETWLIVGIICLIIGIILVGVLILIASVL